MNRWFRGKVDTLFGREPCLVLILSVLCAAFVDKFIFAENFWVGKVFGEGLRF